MKKYNVTLDEKAVDKVKKVLKLSGMKLSNYLNINILQFAKICDDTGVSKSVDSVGPSDTVQMMADLLKSVQIERGINKARLLAKKELHGKK